MPYEGLVRIGRQGPRWTGVVRLIPEKLAEPLRWKRPQRVFVNSMSDLFHEELTNEEIAAVFGVMAQSPRHTFQVLTKRSGRMREWFEWVTRPEREHGPPPDHVVTTYAANRIDIDQIQRPWPLPNVWIGVSAEDQEHATARLPDLVRVPAAVRFVSYEPALGPLRLGVDRDATTRPFGLATCPQCRGFGGVLTSLVPDANGHEQIRACNHCDSSGCAIDWIIVGGESGPGARWFDVQWARDIVAECRSAGVAPFVKQFGANAYHHPPLWGGFVPLNLRNRKGGDPAEWPPGDWPREFPTVSVGD